jgi:leader peptidase (prepilin peptidase)/N-methyltransferase
VLGLVLVSFLVPIALIDLDHRIIPNRLTGPAAVVAVVLGLLLDPSGEPERLMAAGIGGGLLFVLALAHPRGMGMGDAKLVGVLGLYLGAQLAPAVLIALAAGVTVGVVVIARVGTTRGRKTAVPFGPFLALGGVVGLLAGEPIVDWYLRTLV